MLTKSVYHLRHGVQVRSENFGLLFYHHAGPKLYFVPSRDLIDASFFYGESTLAGLIGAVRDKRGWSEETARLRILSILRLLKSRGLVYEQPAC
ncbi:MAG: mycofactocin biosynthesis chaperone MftB [Thermodesulfobacteriota bacterium]